jgi:hypothetical protein
MAFVHGKGIYVGIAVSGATAPTSNISQYCNKCDMPRTVDTADTSTFGSSDKTALPGMKSGTFSIEGLWDTTIDGILEPKLGTVIAVFYAPGGSGTIGYYADAIMTAYNPPGSLTEAVKWSANFMITGAVTRATVTAA